MALEQLGPMKTHFTDAHDSDFFESHYFLLLYSSLMQRSPRENFLSHNGSSF
jgi:hypothetical protein